MRFGYIALGTPPIQSLDIRKMPKLTDMQIRAWIKSGERFEGGQTVTVYTYVTVKPTKPPHGDSAINSQGSPAPC